MTSEAIISWTLADAMQREGGYSPGTLDMKRCRAAVFQLSQHTLRADDRLSVLYAQLAADVAIALSQPSDEVEVESGGTQPQERIPAEDTVIFSLEVQDLIDYIELDEEIEPDIRERSLDILTGDITPQIRAVIGRAAGQHSDKIRQVYREWTDSLSIAEHIN